MLPLKIEIFRDSIRVSSGDQKWRKGLMTFEMMLEEKKDEAFERGIEQGIEQGAYQKSLETAEKLLADNIAPEIVVKYTGLPLEMVIKLKGSE